MSIKELYCLLLNIPVNTCDALPFPVKTVFFKKGETITPYGKIEDSIYFINDGIVEMTIKSYVSEKILDLFFENDLFCAYTSFITQLPADVQNTALTDCEMQRIKRDDLLHAYDTSFEANKFGRIATEQGYVRRSNREKELFTKTAEERYSEMFRTHAKYISNIPVNKIAKYLGVHPESLSRIRRKLNS